MKAKAAAGGGQIVVSSISLAEIVYLIEKHRPLAANAYTDLKTALDDPDHVFKGAPFTVEIVDLRCEPASGHALENRDRRPQYPLGWKENEPKERERP